MTSTKHTAAPRMLEALRPVAERAFDEHLRQATDWYPHEYIPWSQGRDYDGVLGGEAWEPGQRRMTVAVRDAVLHNLLSEENLPGYHRVIAQMLSMDGVWGAWVNRWTLEEARHGAALRDYLIVTRAIDPVALEQSRVGHLQTGYDLDYPGDLLASLTYVTVQEQGTRLTYQNIRRQCGEPACEALMQRIVADENRHMLFYRTLLNAALDLWPDQAMQAVAKVVATFRSPAHAAAEYPRLARSMTRSGIYTVATHHDEVLLPLARSLGLLERDGLTGAGRQSQDRVGELLAKAAELAERFSRRTDPAPREPGSPLATLAPPATNTVS